MDLAFGVSLAGTSYPMVVRPYQTLSIPWAMDPGAGWSRDGSGKWVVKGSP